MFSTTSTLRFAVAFGRFRNIADTLLLRLNSGGAPNRFVMLERRELLVLPYEGMPGRYQFNTPLCMLLWQPTNATDVTVITSNQSDGSEFAVRKLARFLTGSVVQLQVFDMEREYPGCKFVYFRNHRAIARSIAAMKAENGWQFLTSGESLPFEDTKAYEEADVSNRLTRTMIAEYLRRLGVDPREAGFWRTHQWAILRDSSDEEGEAAGEVQSRS